MTTIIDQMKKEAILRERCVQIFGEQDADLHCQRILARIETEWRKTARIMGDILVEFERTQHAD